VLYAHYPKGVPTANPLYWFCRLGLRLLMPAFWKVRVLNRHLEPTEGGAIYISNHQSFLDPMLMSFSLQRPMNYMARDTLFRSPLFRRLISSLNSFPVRRGTADTGAIKEAMRRLKGGGTLCIFPEGTRTRDGAIGPFLPGIATLAKRAAKWVVPVLIDGAFEAWPRTQRFPGAGSIIVRYAAPIPQETACGMSAEQFVSHVRGIILDMQQDTRRRMGRDKPWARTESRAEVS
jgi:1-acyl-sn-glycerol-3-phosphate acyltransferase